MKKPTDDLDAVRLLIDSGQWSEVQIQKSIDTYIRLSGGKDLCPQAILVIDAWMNTLEWTPERAEGHISKLCAFLKNEKLSVWEYFLPRIGEGLVCLATAPVDLYRCVSLADKEPNLRVGAHKLMAMLYAYVNAELPDHFMVGAMRTGAILYVLGNKTYPLAQRLTWLKEYADYVIPSGDLVRLWGSVESPIKEALALWCFMSAKKGDVPSSAWRDAGLPEAQASKKKFLKEHAPGIVDRIGMLEALELPYADAVDMLIDAGDGRLQAPMLELPDLADMAARSGI